jgi:N-acetylglucosaminyl-diphospho-decaprenol L-rhamnosyltransferase
LPALFVSYSTTRGGAERLLVDVASGLDGPPLLACPEGPLAERARAAGLRVFPLRERRLELRASARDRAEAPLRIGTQALEVRRLVCDLRPDALVGWNMRAALSCAAALRGLRPRPRFLVQQNDFLPGPLIARAVRRACGGADAVVAVSESVARDLDPRGELGGRLRVIHPGVDLARFAPAPPRGGAPTVLVLGALVPWKRPELALEAVWLAAGELPELRLVLAGGALGEAGERLERELRRRAVKPDLAGRVELAGPVDPVAALRDASCLLHCAEREPFGMVVAEALACARPAVVPAAGGPAEIVDESCGRLYLPGDAAGAAEALLETLASREELGAGARQRAEGAFDLAGTRRRFSELLGRYDATGRGAGMALVTVTHDSEHDLRRLLASVSRHLPAARVVVVDSGSADASAAAAREWPGGAEVIELGENAGFGRGSNAGLGAVREPVTVLLNPDVELVDGSLAKLAAELERPNAAERILAPLVLSPDGSRQDTAHPEPHSAPALASAVVPPAAMPPPLRRAAQPWRATAPRRAAWAVGCCLAARTETLRRLGPFDERAFMYAEDMELGLRAGEQGIATWFRPEARVVHQRAHSSERAFGGEPFELLARRRREVIRERRGPTAARLDDWAQLTTFATRIALKRLARRSAERERHQLAALRRARARA